MTEQVDLHWNAATLTRSDFAPGGVKLTVEGHFLDYAAEILREELWDRFDAGELRRVVQAAVDDANERGELAAERDEVRAREFLNDLAVKPPG